VPVAWGCASAPTICSSRRVRGHRAVLSRVASRLRRNPRGCHARAIRCGTPRSPTVNLGRPLPASERRFCQIGAGGCPGPDRLPKLRTGVRFPSLALRKSPEPLSGPPLSNRRRVRRAHWQPSARSERYRPATDLTAVQMHPTTEDPSVGSPVVLDILVLVSARAGLSGLHLDCLTRPGRWR